MAVIAVIACTIAVTVVLNGCGAGSLLGDMDWDGARSSRRVQGSRPAQLDFWNAKLLHNNLAGQGPDKGGEFIRYGGVGHIDGEPFDMKVKVIKRDYNVPANNVNGLTGHFGAISVKTGKKAKLQFTFVKPGTNDKVTVDDFFFSFFDIDESLTSQEVIHVKDWDSIYFPEDKQFHVTDNFQGGTLVSSTHHGTVCDNPEHPTDMEKVVCGGNTVDKAKRLFTVRMRSKSSFKVEFRSRLKGNAKRQKGKGGRVMLFAGASPLVAHLMGDADPANDDGVPHPMAGMPSDGTLPLPPVDGTLPVGALPPVGDFTPVGGAPAVSALPVAFGGVPIGTASLPCSEMDLSRPLIHNNLGGKGPQRGGKFMRWEGVTTHNGDSIDLFIKTLNSDYVAPQNNVNGVNSNFFGSISVATGHKAKLKFIFMKTGTYEQVELPNFGFTIYDIDESHSSKEEVVVRDYEQISIPDKAQYDVHVDGTGHVITSTQFGTVCDNPTHAEDLTKITCNGNTVDRAKRLLSMQYRNKQSFEMDFTSVEKEHNKRGNKGGRVFLFSGTCSL